MTVQPQLSLPADSASSVTACSFPARVSQMNQLTSCVSSGFALESQLRALCTRLHTVADEGFVLCQRARDSSWYGRASSAYRAQVDELYNSYVLLDALCCSVEEYA